MRERVATETLPKFGVRLHFIRPLIEKIEDILIVARDAPAVSTERECRQELPREVILEELASGGSIDFLGRRNPYVERAMR